MSWVCAQIIISLKRVIETTKPARRGAQRYAGSIDLGTGSLLSDKKLRRTAQFPHALCEHTASVLRVPRWLPICLGTQFQESRWRRDLWARGDWTLTPELCPSLSWQGPVTAELLKSSWEKFYMGLLRQGHPRRGPLEVG